MLNFYVFNVQGIWNRSRYDVTVSRSFQGHGKVKGQMSAPANVDVHLHDISCVHAEETASSHTHTGFRPSRSSFNSP